MPNPLNEEEKVPYVAFVYIFVREESMIVIILTYHCNLTDVDVLNLIVAFNLPD